MGSIATFLAPRLWMRSALAPITSGAPIMRPRLWAIVSSSSFTWGEVTLEQEVEEKLEEEVEEVENKLEGDLKEEVHLHRVQGCGVAVAVVLHRILPLVALHDSGHPL